MTNRYKIVTASDNIHWVPLEPLFEDVIEQYEATTDPTLRAALASVGTFIEALITEGLSNDQEQSK